jgi:L,D-peptidoglycan transpeptidase YkuD (ErfK/YbiS/YcfS/YnhG family)
MRSIAAALLLGAVAGCSTNGPAASPAATDAGGHADAAAVADAAGVLPKSPIGADTTELVTVISSAWSSVPATLRRYERAGSAWQAVGDPIPVVLGKSGLAWGIGVQAATSDGGPVKHEGDGCSPAGVFSVGTAFGYATPDLATWLKLPYEQATDDLECVDDPASSHYNTLVHRGAIANVDWQSSEQMKRPDSLYRWGLFVNHNSDPPKPGAGSCIFVHLWSGPSSSTVGCTAGEESQIKTVLGWLDPAKRPLIVQLPQSVYDAHRADWGLP